MNLVNIVDMSFLTRTFILYDIIKLIRRQLKFPQKNSLPRIAVQLTRPLPQPRNFAVISRKNTQIYSSASGVPKVVCSCPRDAGLHCHFSPKR